VRPLYSPPVVLRSDLDSDRMLQNAIVRSIEVVGEAAVNVSREFRDQEKGIPWAKLTGMRNRLVHAYFDIDPNIVWARLRRIWNGSSPI